MRRPGHRAARAWRIGILLVLLLAVGAWAASVERRRARRRAWTEPLRVALIAVASGRPALPPAAPLERWFAGELARYRPQAAPPTFEWFGPVAARPLAWAADQGGVFARAWQAWRLSRGLAEIDAVAGVRTRAFGARLYVAFEPADAAGTEFAEGVAEAGGDVALVRASVKGDPSLLYAAVAHELLHLVGAADKYDAAGLPAWPAGLAEPERGAQQRFAEVMAAAFPGGVLPRSLDELRVGAVTAAEVGWTAPARR